jgi:hypothetical protein
VHIYIYIGGCVCVRTDLKKSILPRDAARRWRRCALWCDQSERKLNPPASLALRVCQTSAAAQRFTTNHIWLLMWAVGNEQYNCMRSSRWGGFNICDWPPKIDASKVRRNRLGKFSCGLSRDGTATQQIRLKRNVPLYHSNPASDAPTSLSAQSVRPERSPIRVPFLSRPSVPLLSLPVWYFQRDVESR